MISRYTTALAGALCLVAASACGNAEPDSAADGVADADTQQILLFSYSTGWRHDSIPAGVEALTALGEREGYSVINSEDPAIFNDEDLARFDAIIFLNSTTGKDVENEWFTGERRDALQDFVRAGKGVAGIHGASDSHYSWDWYGDMIGGYFERHPQGTPTGELTVVNADHPATSHMEPVFSRTDEWYWIVDFDPSVDLLVTLDPESIGEPEGDEKPISWSHEFDGGRVFYTSMGHTIETYSDPVFLDHVAGGIAWVLDEAE